MKTMFALLALMLPGPVWACAGKAAGGGCSHGGGCGQLAGVLMAAVAVLGYWTLNRAEKDTGQAKKAGLAVGWVLVVIGLLGFLCSAAGHISNKAEHSSCAVKERAAAYPDMMQMPPGHPQIEGMAESKKGAK
ncbi:MAG: hypothetical protein AAB578_01800 [Elusimicrobiota bacterium]